MVVYYKMVKNMDRGFSDCRRVLFVCTGNTCRSPMAEYCFAALTGNSGIECASAGVGAFPGDPMSEMALQVLAERGIDGSAFRSRRIGDLLVANSDLILAMGQGHLREICRCFPFAAEKTVLLMDFAGGGDVADPFGGNKEVYRRCLAGMLPALENLAETLVKK